MSTNASGCGGNAGQECSCADILAREAPAERSGALVDDNVGMLVAAGAAMAANCEPCLGKIVGSLLEAGVPNDAIRKAIEVGQFVKDKPAAIMMEAADTLAGTHLVRRSEPASCPAEAMAQKSDFKVAMLIAAGAAMAANCEPCLNKAVPELIEAGVAGADIRRALLIGQFVKDQPAAIMKEAADALAGTHLSRERASTCV